MIQTQTSIKVRYAETDAMGVAYHANYIIWLDVARTDMLTQLGLPYKTLEQEGYFLAVLDAQIKYRKPAFFDDDLIVTTTVQEKPLVRLHIEYTIHREETLLVTAKTSHAFINKDTQPIRPPAHFLQFIESKLSS